MAQNVTDLEQRVEVLEVEVANIEDDINDIETDLDLQTIRISHVEDDVSQNTIQIFGILFILNLFIGVYSFCKNTNNCLCIALGFSPKIKLIIFTT